MGSKSTQSYLVSLHFSAPFPTQVFLFVRYNSGCHGSSLSELHTNAKTYVFDIIMYVCACKWHIRSSCEAELERLVYKL